MIEQENPPYVVSEDISLLLERWANKNDFVLPNANFFSGLRKDFNEYFCNIFDKFELVPEKEITDGLKEIVDKSGLFPVTLDRTYYLSKLSLDITRCVDNNGQNKGLGRRKDSPLLLQQFKNLKSSGIKEVTLIDDVIFSGDLIRRVGNLLENIGIKVPTICAGIAIKEGVDQLNGFGKNVKFVREYRVVLDEVCERDFYPGVPLCGRSLISKNNISVPYILPFGNLNKWASIPKKFEIPLSRFCINQTKKLFEAIEKKSNKIVKCSDLPRSVIGLPYDETRFIDAINAKISDDSKCD